MGIAPQNGGLKNSPLRGRCRDGSIEWL